MVNQSPQKEKAILKNEQRIYLVSACLLGLQTRYDGKLKPSAHCQEFLEGACWIPVCPEQLGGLATPRTAADIRGGDGYDVLEGRAKVITRDGDDVTKQFLLGACQVLEIVKRQQINAVLMKSKSPSCAVSDKIGVTAALLQKNSFEILEFG